MCDCLCICCDAVVHLTAEVHDFGFKWWKDLFDELDAFVWGSVLDYDEWLALGVDWRAMEGMDWYDLNILRQVFIESCEFRGFTRGLPADNGSNLRSLIATKRVNISGSSQPAQKRGGEHTRSIQGNNLVNGLCLYAVYDIIAYSRYQMAIRKDVDIILWLSVDLMSNFTTLIYGMHVWRGKMNRKIRKKKIWRTYFRCIFLF